MTTSIQALGPYQVLDALGDGGTGLVLRATHGETRAFVAIKIPKHEGIQPRVALRREIGVLRRLARAGIRGVVEILDHGESDGLPWYAMELVQGHSLGFWSSMLWQSAGLGASLEPGARRRAGGGQLERVLRLALCLAETVAQLHSEGVIHGDITPRNVLMRGEGDPALIDFGTALATDGSDPHRERSIGGEAVRGTPGYLAPESLDGEELDARSDLYSLGSVLYELLSGRAPFAAPRVEDILRRQMSGSVLPLSHSVEGIPPEVERVVGKLLERDPAARLSHADEVCRALCAGLEQPPLKLRPLGVHPMLLRARVHGRGAALGTLEKRAGEARAGRGGLVLVSGPAGSGKSRLLRELRRRASALGFVVQTGLTPGADGSSEGALLRSMFVALSETAKTSPLLVLLDEVDRNEELAIAFLRRYALELGTTRVLVVATESGSGLLAGKVTAGALSELVLEPLGLGDVRSMVKDLLGTEVLPDGFLDFIAENARGNPLYVAEYARAALSRGLLSRHEGAWRFEPTTGGQGAPTLVPASIEGLFELRLAELTQSGRDALRAASVLNHDFDAAALQVVAPGVPEPADTLEELVTCGILAATADGHYRFVQEKLREAQEARIPAGERTALHRAVAAHLTAQSDATRAADDVLGYHFAEGGDSERAVSHLEKAGREATSRHAPGRAAELFRRAVAHAGKLPDSAGGARRLLELEEAFADALVKLARHQEARDRLNAALALPGATESLGRARLLRKLASSWCTVHDYEKAAELTSRAEQTLGAGDARDAAARSELIQIRLGRFDQLYFAGKLGAELDRLVDELAPLIEAHGTPEQSCTYYFMATSHAFLKSRYAFDERALAFAENGLRAAQASGGQRLGMAAFILGGALLLGTREQCARALPYFEQAAEASVRSGDNTLVSRVRTYQAVAHLRLGDVPRVSRAAELAEEAAETAGLKPYVVAARAFRGWVLWRRGDGARAKTLLERARAEWKTHPHRFPFNNLAIFPLLDLAQTSDDFEAAEALLGDLPNGLPALPERLLAASQAAVDAIRHAEPRAASKALASVLALAREAALC